MIDLLAKVITGALLIVAIAGVGKTKYAFLAGLLSLFPIFTTISLYTVGTANSAMQLRNVIVFTAWSLIPYSVFLLTVFYLYNRTSIYGALGGGLFAWMLSASILVLLVGR